MNPRRISWLLVPILMAVAAVPAAAQADSVRPSPRLVRLKTFWKLVGNASTTIGKRSGGVGDINDDGYDDWCVTAERRGGSITLTVTRFYLGAADSADVRMSQVRDGYYYASGDFWGNGDQGVLLVEPKSFFGSSAQNLRVYREDGDSLAAEAATSFDTVLDSATWHYLRVNSAEAADMDGDGDDELVLAVNFFSQNNVDDERAQFWIYPGGPGFSLDTPAVILRDVIQQASGLPIFFAIRDIDGDTSPDLVATTQHPSDTGYRRLLIWWGTATIAALNRAPDAAFDHGMAAALAVGDADGDGRADIFLYGGLVYLSSDKDARTRSYRPQDADRVLYGNVRSLLPLGPMNDSTGRYSTVGVAQFISRSSGSRLAVLSGSDAGPDAQYEAYWLPGWDIGAMGLGFGGRSVGDVNGDGWSDAIYSNSQFPETDIGSAAVFLGGSYIPRDFEYAAAPGAMDESDEALLGVSPNPATGRVMITWRLPSGQAPAFLEITDALGRTVTRHGLAPTAASHCLDCTDLSPGAYFIVLRDRFRRSLVSTPLLRQ